MALAVVLLSGAALLIRTFTALRTVNPGFDAHNVLTMQMSVGGPRFEKSAGTAQLVREAERRIGSLPGIEAVAATCSLPLEPSFDLPINMPGAHQRTVPTTAMSSGAMFRRLLCCFQNSSASWKDIYGFG